MDQDKVNAVREKLMIADWNELTNGEQIAARFIMLGCAGESHKFLSNNIIETLLTQAYEGS